ncbi:MAG: hypothetical protein IJQ62_03890 [Clostridia bacterium]|nr:hypothetical protein [Clostridia bacterium]
MVRRFLLYSQRHGRPVKALFAETMKYQNIRVDSIEEDQVTYHTAARKTPVTVPISAFLSVSYARGDDGDTLKFAVWEQEEKAHE